MALLNGKVVSFEGLSPREIAELILNESPTGDGKGITIILTPKEDNALPDVRGIATPWNFARFIENEIFERTGKKPEKFPIYCTESKRKIIITT